MSEKKINLDPKGHYNSTIPVIKDYESHRWFRNKISKAGYFMTKESIKTHIPKREFHICLELGPGHGTWTKELLAINVNAQYDLVDVSAAMLDLVKKRFKKKENINYYESDFLEFASNKKYDFFFSVRAVEYILDKKELVNKIIALLINDGQGFIITKTPKYFRNKILRRRIKDFHKGQIAPGKFKELLQDAGARKIRIYPVTMSWPFWQSAKINLFLHKIFYRLPLNFISQFFSESYCVIFQKK